MLTGNARCRSLTIRREIDRIHDENSAGNHKDYTNLEPTLTSFGFEHLLKQ